MAVVQLCTLKNATLSLINSLLSQKERRVKVKWIIHLDADELLGWFRWKTLGMFWGNGAPLLTAMINLPLPMLCTVDTIKISHKNLLHGHEKASQPGIEYNHWKETIRNINIKNTQCRSIDPYIPISGTIPVQLRELPLHQWLHESWDSNSWQVRKPPLLEYHKDTTFPTEPNMQQTSSY